LKRLSRFIYQLAVRYLENDCSVRAAGISYYAFFAMIPALIALTLLLEVNRLMPILAQWLLPTAVHDIQEYLAVALSHSGIVTSASVVFAVGVLSKITYHFDRAMRMIWRVRSEGYRPNLFLQFERTLALCGFGAIFLPIGIVLGRWGLAPFVAELITAWLFCLMFNRVFTPRDVAGWRQLLPGSLVGGSVWVATKWGFSSYLAYSGATIFSVLGVFPLFLLWIYVSASLLLLSGCLNATLNSAEYRAKGKKQH
jgi:uncharacterized BrkB/YihY/UPF0761 family membrane protein